MEEEEFWDSPKWMKIRPRRVHLNSLLSLWLERVVFLVHFIYYSVFFSPGEAARLLGLVRLLVRLLLSLVEPPSHTGPAHSVPFLQHTV